MTRGEYITELRKKKNYTQDYVADKLGLTRSAISKYEHDASEMSLDIMEQMSIIYEDKLINIIYGDSNAYKNIESDIEKLHYEKHQFELNNLKLKKKLSIQFLTSFTLLTLMCLVFFIYYFINTYSSIKVYSIMPQDKNPVTIENGNLIITNQEILFNLSNIDINKKIEKIELYINNNFISSKVNSNSILIKDHIESQSYFDFKTINEDINNLYLKIYTDTQIITTKLILKKVYNNTNLFFYDKSNSTSKNNENTLSLIVNNQEYKYLRINEGIIKFRNDNNNENWILSIKENSVIYENRKIGNFQYNVTTNKYILGEPNDEKLELFFKIYEKYKELEE